MSDKLLCRRSAFTAGRTITAANSPRSSGVSIRYCLALIPGQGGHPERSRRFELLTPNRDKPDFNAPVERSSNPLEQIEGVALIIGGFQPADRGSTGAYPLGQFALGNPRLRPKVIDLPRDFSVQYLFLVFLNALGIVADVAIIRVLKGGRLKRSLLAGGAVDAQYVGIVIGVGRQDEGDDLRLTLESLGEHRADRAVDLSAGENFALTHAAFALDEAAGETSAGVGVFAVINREGKEIDAFARIGVGDGCG